MMYKKTVYTAGGIIAYFDNEWYYLVLQQTRQNKKIFIDENSQKSSYQWTFPKGHIEQGESVITTAYREIYEEAGLMDLQFVTHLGVYNYELFWRGEALTKIVHWLLFISPTTNVILNREEGFVDAKWLSYVDTLSLVTHKNLVPFINKAHNLLNLNI